MNKLAKFSVVIFFIYLVGFFVAVPAGILITKTQSVTLINFSYKVRKGLYESWVHKLDQNNMIHDIWGKNTIFWCNQFESCTVTDNRNSHNKALK